MRGMEYSGTNAPAGGGDKLRGMLRGKPAPSKWDDAQKWLAGLSAGSGGGGQGCKSKGRSSNADDRRLLSCGSQKRDSCSSTEGAVEDNGYGDGETKKMDESGWRPVPRSVCVRDAGTEMTPVASQEPSRTATPIRATTPVTRSPVSSLPSTPGRVWRGNEAATEVVFGAANVTGTDTGAGESEQKTLSGSLESRAIAWDEAERAKYMARYKREEVKIQAWENHEKRKAETEMKRMEVKAERIKSRAQEKMANKLAATKRIAEEKRSNAEAKLNEQAAITSERADYIRRTGRLPSSFSFKMPSFCG